MDSRSPDVRARLRAHRQRVARIRKRVIAGATSTFVLAWGVIFMQLVSGHDPALAHKAKTTASTSSSTRQRSSSSASSSPGSTSSSSTSSLGTTSPVTTSQS